LEILGAGAEGWNIAHGSEVGDEVKYVGGRIRTGLGLYEGFLISSDLFKREI